MDHDRPCTDYHIVTNSHGKDGSIRPDRNPIADAGRFPQLFVASGSAGGKSIIYKHNAMADKTVLSYSYPLTNKGMGLDSGPMAYLDIGLYLNKGTDKNMVTDGTIVEINRFDDDYLFAELHLHDPDLPESRLHD
jgi:hypothetical protein